MRYIIRESANWGKFYLKLVKSNKGSGDLRAAFGAHNHGLNRDRAIAQTGRFEPSDKRCNNSAPVFSSYRFLPTPRIFILATSLTDHHRPPRDVSPTFARNPLFARQTRIVCSQESAVVVAGGPTGSCKRERNFNYGNITCRPWIIALADFGRSNRFNQFDETLYLKFRNINLSLSAVIAFNVWLNIDSFSVNAYL